MERWIRTAKYRDGTLVSEGDKIRSIQAPGGMFNPDGWKTGVAAKLERQPSKWSDPDELFLFDGHHYYNIYSHITEHVD